MARLEPKCVKGKTPCRPIQEELNDNPYYNLIKDCGAAEREENKWSGDSDVDGRTIHFESEFNDIKNWIIRHMDFLDKTVFSVNTDIQNIDHSPSFNHSMSIYNLQGKRLYSTKRGINIVDGKKVMIK